MDEFQMVGVPLLPAVLSEASRIFLDEPVLGF